MKISQSFLSLLFPLWPLSLLLTPSTQALPWRVGPSVGGEQWKCEGRCSAAGLVFLWTHGRHLFQTKKKKKKKKLFDIILAIARLYCSRDDTFYPVSIAGEEHHPPPVFHWAIRVAQEEPLPGTLHGWHHGPGQHHRWWHRVSLPEGQSSQRPGLWTMSRTFSFWEVHWVNLYRHPEWTVNLNELIN